MSTVTFGAAEISDVHIAGNADIARSKMVQRVLAELPVALTDLRVWDAMQTNLPGTGASDDLALIATTWGTDPPTVQTGDLKAAGSTTRRARFQVRVPPDFEAGQTAQIRCKAGMKTTVADVAATIDIECYRVKGDGTLDAAGDLCTTAATTINSLTVSNKDFTITNAVIQPGDILDVRVSILVNDAATVTAVIGLLAGLSLLADLR
jgi:hypothetical protein